jgi:membrane-bound lytic murein transglycosylase B
MPIFCLTILLSTLLLVSPSHAACRGGDFNTFVSSISADAQAAGISKGVIHQALGGVQHMRALNFDRCQGGTVYNLFEQYVSTQVGPGSGNGDRPMLQRHATLPSDIE